MKSPKKYLWVLNLIRKLKLFLPEDKDFNFVLDRFDLGSNVLLILAIVTWFLWRKLRSATKDLFSIKLMLMLPEDLQAILEDMQKRWIKKQYSPQKIGYLKLRYLFDMVLGYVKSQIENTWLSNDSSTKEIE